MDGVSVNSPISRHYNDPAMVEFLQDIVIVPNKLLICEYTFFDKDK